MESKDATPNSEDSTQPAFEATFSRLIDIVSKYIPLVAILIGVILTCGWISRQVTLNAAGIYGIGTDRETLIATGAFFLCASLLPISILFANQIRDGGVRILITSCGFFASLAAVAVTFCYTGLSPVTILEDWATFYGATLGAGVAWSFTRKLALGSAEKRVSKIKELDEKDQNLFGAVSDRAALMFIDLGLSFAGLFLFSVWFGTIILPDTPGNLGGMQFPRSKIHLKEPDEHVEGKVVALDANWIVVVEPTITKEGKKIFVKRRFPWTRISNIESDSSLIVPREENKGAFSFFSGN